MRGRLAGLSRLGWHVRPAEMAGWFFRPTSLFEEDHRKAIGQLLKAPCL